MNTVKFISTQYLKDNTAIQSNVDNTLLEPYILKAQDTHIQQILGTNYYVHLGNAVVSSSLSAIETDLIKNYIQPAIAEWTFYEVLPHINYKSTNKAVSQNTSENSSPSQLADIKYLRNSIRDLAEYYSERLVRELTDNSSKYPLYLNQGVNNVLTNKNVYFNGLYISGRSRRCSWDTP